MEKTYIVYEPGFDLGYLMEDIYTHLYWIGGKKLEYKLEKKLETCKTREEQLSVIGQFVTLVDRREYAKEITKMDAERYVKKKQLVLRVISENPGIRLDEIDVIACTDCFSAVSELVKENLVKVSSLKLPLSGGLDKITLYENIEKYKDIEVYDCYLTR